MLKAIVAARGGSARVRRKNDRPFAGSTLLDIKIRQLHRMVGVDAVVLSSEDEAIIALGRELGCEILRRPQSLASSSTPMPEAFAYMAEHCRCDTVLYANCTNPLIRDDTMQRAIELWMGVRGECDSLNSATEIREFLYLDGRPLNFDPRVHPRSQDLPDITAFNFAVNILSRETMVRRRNVIGAHPYIYKTTEVEGFDIDTPLDFAFAEYAYSSGRGTG